MTRASVALPIWESIVKAAWANGVPKTSLAPPSPEARKLIADLPIELNSGERLGRGSRSAFIEHFRLNAKGALVEPKDRMVEGAGDDRVTQRRYVSAENTSTRHPRVAQRGSTPTVGNVATQCFLFFCNTSAHPRHERSLLLYNRSDRIRA
jgi:hypothetical protein